MTTIQRGLWYGVLSFGAPLCLICLGAWFYYQISYQNYVESFFQKSLNECRLTEQTFLQNERNLIKDIGQETRAMATQLMKPPRIRFKAADFFQNASQMDLKDYSENDIARAWKLKFLPKLRQAHQAVLKRWPILEADLQKPQTFWLQFFSMEPAIHYHSSLGFAIGSQATEQVRHDIWPEPALGGTESFLIPTFSSLVMRYYYSDAVREQFFSPIKKLFGIDLIGEWDDPGLLKVLDSRMYIRYQGIPASEDRLSSIFHSASVQNVPMGFLIIVLDSQLYLHKTLLLEESTFDHQVINFRANDSIASVPILTSQPMFLIDAVSNQPLNQEISPNQIIPALQKQPAMKLLAHTRQGPYLIHLVRDSIHGQNVRVFSTPLRVIEIETRQKILKWLQIICVVVGGFLCISLVAMRTLLMPLRALLGRVSAMTSWIQGLTLSTGRQQIAFQPEESSSFYEINIIERAFQRYTHGILEQMELLSVLVELQSRIRQNFPCQENLDWLNEVLPEANVAQTGQETASQLIRKLMQDARQGRRIERAEFMKIFAHFLEFDKSKAALRSQAVQTQIHKQEFTLAAEVQKSLLHLPKETPDWLEIASFYEPARFLGGDFYFVSLQKPQQPLLIVADVSGKGLASSIYGARVQNLIETFWPLTADVGSLLAKVNSEMCRYEIDGYFCTLFAMALNGQSQTIEYASAGHNKMFCFGSQGWTELSARGLPLGLFSTGKYEVRQMPMHAHLEFLLYTDGVIEAEDTMQNLYGMTRLKTFLQSRTLIGPQDCVSALAQELHTFSDGADPADDITLLWARLIPAA